MTVQERIDYLTTTSADLVAQLKQLVVLQQQIEDAGAEVRNLPRGRVDGSQNSARADRGAGAFDWG